MKLKSVNCWRVIALTVLLVWLPKASLASADTFTILVLGDSLSAAYGIEEESGWVELFKQWLQKKGDYRVVNASLSSETSSGALRRLPKLLQDYQPDLMIVELGGNDGLRGQSTKLLENNLTKIVQLGKQHGSDAYLLGMLIPPNYGQKYTQQFHAAFYSVAEQQNIALLPFFLEGVATHRELMQADGIHPNAKAQPMLLKNLLSKLPASALVKPAAKTAAKEKVEHD